ncbi:MAG: HutD/Ves family protein [Bacteriovorax sp.]
MIKLIKYSDLKETPWKNGRGITRELAIFPEGSTLQKNDFLWRISSATILNSDPFSLFPGCDRELIVWKGDGLFLNNKILPPHSPLHFSGEELIQCDLVGEASVIDVGIIYKKEKVKVSVEVLSIDQGLTTIQLNNRHHFLFIAKGACGALGFNMGEGDCLEVTETPQISLDVHSPSLLYKMSLSPAL